jgi:hypothetical protein
MGVEQIGVDDQIKAENLSAANEGNNSPIEDREFLAKRKEDAMALARLIYDIFEEEKASVNRGEYAKIKEHTT